MNLADSRYAATLCAFIVAMLVSARPAHSQQMNFSYDSDAIISGDGQTLYAIIDGYDNSTGCTHYDYSASAYVYGPTGNFQQQNFPGLSTFMGVPLGQGNYSFYSDAVVDCSCFGSGLSAGGGNGTAEVDSTPSGETTLYNQWADHYATAYAWRASLSGGTFNGRQVREQNGGGDVDTCWFSGSQVAKAWG
jgi:hypothetical protein